MFDFGLFQQDWRQRDRRKNSDEVVLASMASIDSSLWELSMRNCGFREGDFETLQKLSDASSDRNVFFEPPFFTASHERLGLPLKKLITINEKIGTAKNPKLVFPVQPERIGFPGIPVLRAWSHIYGPLSTPLLDEDEARDVSEKLMSGLAEVSDAKWLGLVFQDIPVQSAFVQAIESLGDQGSSAVINCRFERASIRSHSSQNYPQSVLKTKRRKELDRQHRRLAELGDLHLDVATDLIDTLLRFEEFLLMETRSWKGKRGTSLHMIKRTAAFARQAIANLVANDACRIYSLRLNDRAISSVIVLRSGNWYFPWKMAFDENYGKYSVGKILIAAMTRDLIALPGFDGADSLAAPDNEMINQLWPDRIELGNLIIGLGKSAPENARKIARALERKAAIHRYGKQLIGR